jgi:hypothetical protein
MARAMNLEMAQKFTTIFKKLGFQYVALDLEGSRSPKSKPKSSARPKSFKGSSSTSRTRMPKMKMPPRLI